MGDGAESREKLHVVLTYTHLKAVFGAKLNLFVGISV